MHRRTTNVHRNKLPPRHIQLGGHQLDRLGSGKGNSIWTLFGWGKFDIPISDSMTYTMFQHQGQNVAALSDATPEALEQNIPSHWSCYVSVDDVDALLPVVTENGGQLIFGPMDVFDSGRTAFFMGPDRRGAGLVAGEEPHRRRHRQHPSAPCAGTSCSRATRRRPKPSTAPCWGWEFYGDEHYIHIKNRGRNNGGMIQMDESFGETPRLLDALFQHRRNQRGRRRASRNWAVKCI